MHFKVHIMSNITIAFKTRSTFHFQQTEESRDEEERLQTQLDQSVRLTRLTFDTGSVIEIWSGARGEKWAQTGVNSKHSTKRKASDGYETQHHKLKP